MAPVHDAARADDVQRLRELLDADPGVIEAEHELYEHQRPLHLACKAGSMKAVQLLLDRGAGTDTRDASGMTPLLRACEAGRVEVVALLIERGADPTLRSGSRKTALMCAAAGRSDDAGSDHVAVIRLLLKDGRVPVDAKDGVEGYFRCTALFQACAGGHAERARVLLVEGGADHELAWGVTNFARARDKQRQNGHDKCIKLLRWCRDELERAYLLSKARAVVDATESISKAPEKVKAETWEERQKVREEAAPVYLRGRVKDHRPLPVVVEALGQGRGMDDEDAEELRAVYEFLVRYMSADLFVELMQGLRYR